MMIVCLSSAPNFSYVAYLNAVEDAVEETVPPIFSYPLIYANKATSNKQRKNRKEKERKHHQKIKRMLQKDNAK